VTDSAKTTSTTDSYLALTQQLRLLGLTQGPAEIHGTVYGVLCVRPDLQTGDDLLGALQQDGDTDEIDADTARKLLEALQRQAHEVLVGEGFEIKLLLPPDDSEFDGRIQALAEWCRGFLFGLVAAGIKDTTRLPGDAGEAIQDLLSISETGTESDDDESRERALFELTEYVRVAVQLVYEELHPAAGSKNS